MTSKLSLAAAIALAAIIAVPGASYAASQKHKGAASGETGFTNGWLHDNAITKSARRAASFRMPESLSRAGDDDPDREADHAGTKHEHDQGLAGVLVRPLLGPFNGRVHGALHSPFNGRVHGALHSPCRARRP